MSNSKLVVYSKMSPNNSGTRTHVIDTVSVHCVVGQCAIETLGSLFASSSRAASSNYGIGYDGRIGMFVPESKRSWCTSSKSNDQRAITIEVASDTYSPYRVRDAAYKALIELLADICRRNKNVSTLRWQGNKALIGQTSKQNMSVHRWFANKACVPVETEVLTKEGWKSLKEIEVGDEIAVVAPEAGFPIFFDPVIDKIEPYLADTVTCQNFTGTTDHRMLYWSKSSPSQIKVKTYGELLESGSHINRLAFAGQYKGKGIDISDDMIRFLVAVQADGHYMKEYRSDGSPAYGLEFHLKKERKIDRAIGLIQALGFEYSLQNKADGSVSIRVYNAKDNFNIVETCEKWLTGKHFNWNWIELSPEQAEVFFEEIYLWDGCKEAHIYSSSVESDLDIVSAIAALNGIAGHKVGQNFRSQESTSYSIDKWKERADNGETLVSCVTVSTGAFLCRQNGWHFVIGNCPGDYLYNLHGQIAKEVNALLAKKIVYLECEGDAVKEWQELLIKRGYSCGSAGADGDFGSGTDGAVRKFQKDHGLVVDGVIGEKTQAALKLEEVPAKPEKPAETKPETPAEESATTTIVRLSKAEVFAAPPVLTDVTGAFTIVATKDGYGKLKSGAGWVKMPSA